MTRTYDNKPPDEKFKQNFRNICLRPGIYVGEENYKLVAMLLEGMALGYQDWWGGGMSSCLHEGFQSFLAKRYRRKNVAFNNVLWWNIIPLALKDERPKLSEKQLIDRLLADFEDFNNVLVRMAVETVED